MAFLIADPYSVLDFHAFEQGLAHQSSLSGEAQGKLGAPRQSGLVYYLWALTWGLGWVPAIAALAGAVMVWWREHRLGWLLVPAPLLFLLFMGSEGRYFGRWLLPIFPILCLLAAFAALSCARALARASQRLIEKRTHRAEPARPAELIQINGTPARSRLTVVAFSALAVLALCAQGVIYSVHSGLSLSRADTRALARAWMVAHVPVGAKVVVEPIVPDEWVQDVGHPTLTVPDGDRWLKYRSLLSRIAPSGALVPGEGHVVSLENYELHAGPFADPVLRARRVLLGVERLRGVRPRVRRPRACAARGRLLPRACPCGRSCLPRLSLPRRGASGGVQLRLVLRLLPALLLPPWPRSCGLPAAWRALRARMSQLSRSTLRPARGGYPGQLG